MAKLAERLLSKPLNNQPTRQLLRRLGALAAWDFDAGSGFYVRNWRYTATKFLDVGFDYNEKWGPYIATPPDAIVFSDNAVTFHKETDNGVNIRNGSLVVGNTYRARLVFDSYTQGTAGFVVGTTAIKDIVDDRWYEFLDNSPTFVLQALTNPSDFVLNRVDIQQIGEYDLAISGAAWHPGGSLLLDGSNDNLVLYDRPELAGLDSGTLWFRFKMVSSVGPSTIASRGNDFSFLVNSVDSLQMTVFYSGTNALAQSGLKLVDGQVYDVCATWDDGDIRLYVGGEEMPIILGTTGTGTRETGNGDVFIGSNASPSDFLNAEMYAGAMFNRALEPHEVRALSGPNAKPSISFTERSHQLGVLFGWDFGDQLGGRDRTSWTWDVLQEDRGTVIAASTFPQSGWTNVETDPQFPGWRKRLDTNASIGPRDDGKSGILYTQDPVGSFFSFMDIDADIPLGNIYEMSAFVSFWGAGSSIGIGSGSLSGSSTLAHFSAEDSENRRLFGFKAIMMANEGSPTNNLGVAFWGPGPIRVTHVQFLKIGENGASVLGAVYDLNEGAHFFTLNNYVTVPSAELSEALGGQWMIDVKLTALAARSNLIFRRDDFELFANTDGSLSVVIHYDTTDHEATTVAGVIQLNQRAVIFLSWDDVTKEAVLYVNGSLVPWNTSTPGVGARSSGLYQFYLMGDLFNAAAATGFLRRAAFYENALSEDEVYDLTYRLGSLT